MIDDMTNEEYFEYIKRVKESNKIVDAIVQLAKVSGVEITWSNSSNLNINGDVSAIELLLPIISKRKKELLRWLEPEITL
jgi:hypothetical protein